MAGDGWLRQGREGCHQLSCLTFTLLQEFEHPAASWVRQGREDCVAPGFALSSHCVYDHEDFEGSWLIEKRFPSGSENVAEIPQAYSSG